MLNTRFPLGEFCKSDSGSLHWIPFKIWPSTYTTCLTSLRFRSTTYIFYIKIHVFCCRIRLKKCTQNLCFSLHEGIASNFSVTTKSCFFFTLPLQQWGFRSCSSVLVLYRKIRKRFHIRTGYTLHTYTCLQLPTKMTRCVTFTGCSLTSVLFF